MASLTIKNQISSVFKGKKWRLHVIYWTLLAVVFYFQYKAALVAPKYPLAYTMEVSLSRFLTLILLCYSFLFFVMPLYRPKKLIYFWISLILLVFLADCLQVVFVKLILLQFPSLNPIPDTAFLSMLGKYIFALIALFSFFIAAFYFQDIYDRQREIQVLAKFKTEKIALESSFLKSQVNPHFLFNTLNNIYALSLKKSEQTAVIIERLESLLHYMLFECKADLVLLAQEFTFTNSYIALEKLRHRDDQCTVTMNVEGEVKDQYIAPLLLINFLENAFKHGTKASFGKSWINMDIKVSAGGLHFLLQNSKPLQVSLTQPISEYTGGIGLKNVKRRLEILYPGKHTLSITEKKDRFEVDLTLSF
ncbi:sensor histidine kinase [Pedobacter duraquae]|uniref:GHKL domain-containing protein n=1 Tax=Pedobacter duraquae TaxID=425511 RepID=A0A4R6INX0_9SPHI|nr:histidine kinase [Pedobacter duraquae]TDO23952.1 GHKL domain-containing protein [Pedobacter duraquae]